VTKPAACSSIQLCQTPATSRRGGGLPAAARARGARLCTSHPIGPCAPPTLQLDESIGAVVVGWDPLFTYSKLVYASACLRELPGCLFVATNTDHADKIGGANEARMMPGTGCLVAALEVASGRGAVRVGASGACCDLWVLHRCCLVAALGVASGRGAVRAAQRGVLACYWLVTRCCGCTGDMQGVPAWACLALGRRQQAAACTCAPPPYRPGSGGGNDLIRSLLGRSQVNVGKGGSWLFPFLCEHLGLQPSACCVVGDRLDTDIALGKQGGMRTVLPLTGAPGLAASVGRARRCSVTQCTVALRTCGMLLGAASVMLCMLCGSGHVCLVSLACRRDHAEAGAGLSGGRGAGLCCPLRGGARRVAVRQTLRTWICDVTLIWMGRRLCGGTELVWWQHFADAAASLAQAPRHARSERDAAGDRHRACQRLLGQPDIVHDYNHRWQPCKRRSETGRCRAVVIQGMGKAKQPSRNATARDKGAAPVAAAKQRVELSATSEAAVRGILQVQSRAINTSHTRTRMLWLAAPASRC
jgi:ribonucleotide monophosphatase NagD (HAD superfamily)